MTFDSSRLNAQSGDVANVRELQRQVTALRDELWRREGIIEELKSHSVRHAVRRSLSRRIRSAATSAPRLLGSDAGAKLADALEPATGVQRVAQVMIAGPNRAPAVSIVIPVHNQIDATMLCLESIFANSTGHAIEVIVVDDASDAFTRHELAKFNHADAVSVIHTDENVGYLRATNLGASVARGTTLVLLNNDTSVGPGWLDAISETLANPTIGAVGAKLLTPDMRTQEAGAIVWSDGTARHVARDLGRWHPRANTLRDVDYSSAACLAVRRSLWNEIGGFDTAFAPAYYEDVDLCFAIRARGFRVVMQPRCEVIHFEGTSHGTDTSSGLKRYQDINHRTFAAKWKAALKRQSDRGTDERDVLIGGRPTVLVADYQCPKTNEDAGSVRMWSVLEAFVAEGARVVFHATGGVAEDDIGKLGDIGVETLSSDYPLWEFLETEGHLVELAVLSRPQVYLQLLPEIRQRCENARVAFDTVDLHFLREERRAEFTGESSRTAAMFRSLERAAFETADETIVVSDEEARIVQEMCPGAYTRVIPTINAIVDSAPPFDARSDFVFVGGFRHPPNIDAALILAREVLPLIRSSHPDARLRIIGSHPTKEISDLLSCPGVLHAGFVENVEPALDAAVAMVAPLFWGAGVKGKVTQSLGRGLPVVTTSVGSEGLDLVPDQDVLIAESAAGLAEHCIRLLDDQALWQRLSDAGIEAARKRFSPQRLQGEICSMLRTSQTRA